MNLTKHIRPALAACALLSLAGGLTVGCSDNVEPGLYPDSESHISLSVAAPGLENGLLAVGSAQSSTPFAVTSTTRWTVEITDCEGAWCQIVYGDTPADDTGHIGDGTFTLDTSPNRGGDVRSCDVTVYAIESDGTHIPGRSVSFRVEQDRQSIRVDYAGDVISAYGTVAGTQPLVTVTANQAWSVNVSHPWVSVIPGEGMTGDGFTPAPGSETETAVSFRLSIEANPGTSVRTAEVTLSSPSSAFTPIRLNVTQEGSTEIFFVTTPPDVESLPAAGTVVEFTVYSPREAWTVSAITAGDWVSLDRTSGEPSAEPVVIRATVASNPDTSSRQGGLRFSRGGDRGESFVSFSQDGREGGGTPEPPSADNSPRVSEAWIISGWTASWAQLRAYYLSPVIPITGCGAYVYPVGDRDNTMEFSGQLGDGGQIIVDLTGLQPETEYEAYGYVDYMVNGSRVMTTGGATRFTTPARNGEPTPPEP
ncbi:MAG: hypothetical protein K2O24_09620, partial [Muribaculaceae bacterium]|nr:hypothetical protein [Muribaculaceae bacterium]